MTHTLHLPKWSSPAEERTRVTVVHRIGALVVAAVIAAFGVLGLLDGLDYFSTDGERIAGLSSNGLLSTISLLTAAVLVVAAVRGSRTASTIMLVIGALFIASALINLALLETDWNFLAFSVANVIFSICAGLVLLTLGAYGRVSGNLPDDSPYRGAQDAGEEVMESPELPETPAEEAAERAMRAAELAVVEHRATADQLARVQAMAKVRSRSARRTVWMSYDRPMVG
ncbi:DUF4383 domain-containing protein [Modestobacter muralis]|uniref:DUF4383 domain-containing protein n=1 Tax=Modestobacter muralis TaxID=1608614 RepID=A0A6P0H8W3_9ACTN|nr:DUF4383 domain-containing protein [Modestobacter muralis]NEK94641.1 DUF4383 domain-containing protein [Modestobacter muralis]NEN51529.1 DUF4383 domain-containing protein [Modestobacter muralis]